MWRDRRPEVWLVSAKFVFDMRLSRIPPPPGSIVLTTATAQGVGLVMAFAERTRSLRCMNVLAR
jgi:hypothetical protein